MTRTEQKKVSAWRKFLAAPGWKIRRQGGFIRDTPTGREFANFQGETSLTVERKRPLTEEERRQTPLRTTRWDAVLTLSYERVRVGEDGAVFDAKKAPDGTGTSRKTGRKKQEKYNG